MFMPSHLTGAHSSHQPSSCLTEFSLAHADLLNIFRNVLPIRVDYFQPAWLFVRREGESIEKVKERDRIICLSVMYLPIREMRIRPNIKPLLFSHVTFWQTKMNRILLYFFWFVYAIESLFGKYLMERISMTVVSLLGASQSSAQ